MRDDRAYGIYEPVADTSLFSIGVVSVSFDSASSFCGLLVSELSCGTKVSRGCETTTITTRATTMINIRVLFFYS